jgi:hypothetical protein
LHLQLLRLRLLLQLKLVMSTRRERNLSLLTDSSTVSNCILYRNSLESV